MAKDNNKAGEETYRLISIDERGQRSPVVITAEFDPILRVFRVGDQKYPAVQKQGEKNSVYYETKDGVCPVVLSTNESIPVQHGTILRGPEGKFILQMLKDNGYIGQSREVYKSGNRFYVHNEEQEARATATKADKVFDALNLLKNMSATDREELAFFLQLRVQGQSANVIEAKLKEIAMTNPGRILEKPEQRAFKAEAMIRKAIELGIITHSETGIFLGENALGVNIPTAVSFIADPANERMASIIHSSVRANKQTAVTED